MSAAELLEAPGCSRGCPDCVRSCAVAQIKLGWWSPELRRIMAERPVNRAELAEAQEVVSRLAADVRPDTRRRSRARLRVIDGGRI